MAGRTPGPRDVRAWLDDHVNLESGVGTPPSRRVTAPTLERVRGLLALLGSPESDFVSIHITGTNGKTSAARMLVSVLGALGLDAGSYTSPHLEHVNERIGYAGEPIGDEDLDDLLRAVALAEDALGERASYFEILTAAALRWFADLAVRVAVVEVGLGGTWDATNVVDGRVAVVTNVTIDHVDYLGPTRADIAAEKAGIVSPGATLVLGETDPDLAALFSARRPARTLLRDRDFGVRSNVLAVGGRLIDLYTPGGSYPDVLLPLHGAHQADNAAVALAAAEAFVGEAIPASVVASAFATVRSPGRVEVVGRAPLVVLDGAHNVAGAEALRRTLTEEFSGGDRTLVVGFLREKEPHEMLAALGVDDAARVVCCRAPSPRALAPDVLARAALDLGVPEEALEVVESVAEGVGVALSETPPDGQIVVTGSLYVVGAARSVLVR